MSLSQNSLIFNSTDNNLSFSFLYYLFSFWPCTLVISCLLASAVLTVVRVYQAKEDFEGFLFLPLYITCRQSAQVVLTSTIVKMLQLMLQLCLLFCLTSTIVKMLQLCLLFSTGADFRVKKERRRTTYMYTDSDWPDNAGIEFNVFECLTWFWKLNTVWRR